MTGKTEIYVIEDVEVNGSGGEYFASCKIGDEEISGVGVCDVDALGHLQVAVESYIYRTRKAGEPIPSCIKIVEGIAITVTHIIEDEETD